MVLMAWKSKASTEKTMSDVDFRKIMEANPSGLESNSAAFYFGGLGQMNELLSVHFLFIHKKMMLSALLGFCELQEPT